MSHSLKYNQIYYFKPSLNSEEVKTSFDKLPKEIKDKSILIDNTKYPHIKCSHDMDVSLWNLDKFYHYFGAPYINQILIAITLCLVTTPQLLIFNFNIFSIFIINTSLIYFINWVLCIAIQTIRNPNLQ